MEYTSLFPLCFSKMFACLVRTHKTRRIQILPASTVTVSTTAHVLTGAGANFIVARITLLLVQQRSAKGKMKMHRRDGRYFVSSGIRLRFHKCPVLYPVTTISNETEKKGPHTISGKSAYLLFMMALQDQKVPPYLACVINFYIIPEEW